MMCQTSQAGDPQPCTAAPLRTLVSTALSCCIPAALARSSKAGSPSASMAFHSMWLLPHMSRPPAGAIQWCHTLSPVPQHGVNLEHGSKPRQIAAMMYGTGTLALRCIP